MSNSNPLSNKGLFRFSVFSLDINEGLFVQGKPVKLAPKVFQTLVLFAENQGRIISKDELFEKLWADTFVEDNALSFNISQLRKALALYDNETVFIETIPKRGFRFNAEVTEIEREETETEIVYEKYQKQEIIIDEQGQQESLVKPQILHRTNNRVKIFFSLSTFLLLLMIGGFAFWQWRKNAELRSFDSLKTVRLTSWKTTGSNLQRKYSLSNSGNLFSYSTKKSENEEIFIKQIRGGEDIQITQSSWSNFSPIWSPDDLQIAFVSFRENRAGIYICPSLGGNSALLKIFEQVNPSLIKWSNDGSKIFYEIDGNLFAINVESKEISQITDFPSINEGRNFSLSKDERQIAYCEKTNEQKDIWVMRIPNGVPLRITDDPNAESDPVWHPDGKRILYSVIRDGHNQINVGYTDGNQILQLTRSNEEYNLLDISPDGTKIFYVSWEEKSDIWSLDTTSGNEIKTAKEIDSEFWADISPDGKFLSYQINSMPNAISKLNDSAIVIKNTNQNTNQNTIKGINQKWLPDSKRISFLRWETENKRYNLWTFDIVSGEEKQITTNGAGFSGFAVMPYNRNQTKDFSWSADSNKIVYSDSKLRNILLTSIDSNETVNITNNDDPNISFNCPLWSKNDKKIIFVSEEKTNQKPVYNILLFEDDNVRKVFSTNESLRLLGWADTNDDFICLSTNDMMKSRPIDTKLLRISTSGKSEIINSFEQISALSSALSPDGRSIAFTKRQENKDNIYLATINNKQTRKITENSDPETLLGSLIWSFDGKTLFFDKQEKINVISVIENFE
jgi:Tol biopolymer transport system component/DNA-binding winged helix-turn-helix (wHTH) protein